MIANMGETTRASVSIGKLVLWFAIAGGIGVPLLFLAMGQLLLKGLQGTEALLGIMVWFEAFRVMFWPPSMFLVVNAPGSNTSAELSYLLVLILLNVGIYALIGLAVALAFRRRAAQIALGLFLLAAMLGLNLYWSEHIASFLIAAAIVVALLFTRII